MPCRCDDYDVSDKREEVEKIHKLTRVACDMRTILRRHGLESKLCKETLSWIEKHDKEDAERIQEEQASGLREKLKREALNKLTMDERRILGL